MSRRRVAVGDLAVGMVLAADVKGAHGQHLLNAGTVLDDKLIASLQHHSVGTVSIDVPVDQTAESEEAREARRVAIAAAVERRFNHPRTNPVMESLRQAVIEHRLRKGPHA